MFFCIVLNQFNFRSSDHFPNLKGFIRPCKHQTKTFNCNAVCREAIINARKRLYNIPNRVLQNNKIAHFLRVHHPKGKKSYKNVQSVRVTYMLKDTNNILQPVCQKFICAALSLSQRRLLTIAKQVLSNGEIKESRGGDRRSKFYVNNKQAVIEFIGNLKGRMSHYNRKKSARIYLPSELNISKLYRMYNASVEQRLCVKKTFFCNIFATKFNIGFGTPATDVCSFCYQLKNNLKNAVTNEEKNSLMMKHRIHTLSAKQFHIIMKEKPEKCTSFCFDLQQVQVLPKLPIQEAFYATQIALYNFCITDVETKRPIFYSWIESQAARGSNEIGSALYDFLKRYQWPESCNLLRLFCDGCSGQNKNSIVVSMLTFWLAREAPKNFETILLVFPVRGHSFLPADRVFGRIEKITRKKEKILRKEEYWNVFNEVGEVRILEHDWKLYDLKSLSESLVKLKGIRDAKRIYINKTLDRSKVTVRMECYYRSDLNDAQSLLKRGQSFQKITLQEATIGVALKPKKLRDVDKLLDKSYSRVDENGINRNWRELKELEWYKGLIDNDKTGQGAEGEEEEEEKGEKQALDQEEECDCTEEDDRLKL